MKDPEFEALLALPASARYDHFVKRVAARGVLWGLHGSDGWVTAEDDRGEPHIPVWPDPRFAEACATGPWLDTSPRSIDADDWIEAWTPKLERDGLRLSVFQTSDDEGSSVSPERLRRDLEREQNRFGASD